MDIEVREVRHDDADVLRELAQWVTSTDDVRGHNNRLNDRLDQRLGDVVGAISVGGSSRKTGRAFADLLDRRRDGGARGPES